MARVDVFASVGGFNPTLIAGEEPEMCHRIRQAGYCIYRLDVPMTYHDAAMTRFSQWFRRNSRAGYAYAARAAIHRGDGSKYCWWENARIIIWAALVPGIILTLVLAISPWWLLALAIYPMQVFRQWQKLRRLHPHDPVALAALFTLIGKWPEFYGQCLYLARVACHREQRLIEYK